MSESAEEISGSRGARVRAPPKALLGDDCVCVCRFWCRVWGLGGCFLGFGLGSFGVLCSVSDQCPDSVGCVRFCSDQDLCNKRY